MKQKHLQVMFSKKLIAFLLAVAGISLGILFWPKEGKVEFNPVFDYRFHVPSEFSLNGDIWECIRDNENITSSISNPGENSTFKTTDSINFKGNLSITCDGISKEWYLDNQTQAFASGDTANLRNLAEGKHTIAFRVKFTNDYSVESKVNINIERPRVAGVVTPTPTPPVETTPEIPPPVIVYQPPVVSILRPQDGASFTATNYDQLRNRYAKVTLAGSVSDPQDGSLPNSSIVWTYTNANGQVVTIGNGSSTTVNLYAPNCSNLYTIKLKATNSQGLSSQASIKVTVTGYCPSPIILY